MKNRFALVFLLLFSFVVGACESRHVAERPDTTRPTIVSTSPASGATAVLVNAVVTITFSEAMNVSTIDDASFLLESAPTGMVAGAVTYDQASNVATFTPSSVLEHNALYTVTITTKAEDTAGNTLAAQTSWSFTTVPSPGALDSALGSNGRVRTPLGFSDDIVYAAMLQQDGKIITAGLSAVSSSGTSTNLFTLARFQPNGGPDSTFGFPQNGRADYFIGTARTVEQSGEKIIAAGSNDANSISSCDFMIARYSIDGTRDATFNTSGATTINMGYDRAVINAMAIQSDGKIVVAGEGRNLGGAPVSIIARFQTDGTLDASFNASGKIVSTPTITSSAAVVKIQPAGGMIVVGGNIQDISGPPSFYLSRYDSNGVLDPLFSSGTVIASPGTNAVLADIEILPDGKILVAGTTNSPQDDLFLMRYNADGTLDTSFGAGGTVISDDVSHDVETAAGLAVQADGKVIIAARYNPTVGAITTRDFAVFRYNADGTLDTGFGNGYGMVITDLGSGFNDDAADVQIQQDGKIVLVGSAFNGNNFDIGIARFWP